jgi:hypothetical protein
MPNRGRLVSRVVTHRWNLEPHQNPPPVGAIISGPRLHWRVSEVIPVESRKYPNAFRGRLQPLGLHGLTQREREERGWWIYYPRPKVPK